MRKVICKNYKDGKCSIVALNRNTCRAGCYRCCLVECFKDSMPLRLCPKGDSEGNNFDKLIFKHLAAKKNINVYGESIK